MTTAEGRTSLADLEDELSDARAWAAELAFQVEARPVPADLICSGLPPGHISLLGDPMCHEGTD